MIESIKHKGLRRLFEDDDRSGVRPDLAGKLCLILATLDVAQTVEAMQRPDFRLHLLKGDLKGFWAVTVRANWRVIFHFEDGRAFDVDLVDYH